MIHVVFFCFFSICAMYIAALADFLARESHSNTYFTNILCQYKVCFNLAMFHGVTKLASVVIFDSLLKDGKYIRLLIIFLSNSILFFLWCEFYG